MQHGQNTQKIEILHILNTPSTLHKPLSPYDTMDSSQQIQKYALHFNGAGCGIHDTWQAVTEEAINQISGTPQSTKINHNDAYQILQRSQHPSTSITPETRTHVQTILNLIHITPSIIQTILSTKQTYDHDPKTLETLLCHFLSTKWSDYDQSDISIPTTIHNYLNNHIRPLSVLSPNTIQLILQHIDPLTIPSSSRLFHHILNKAIFTSSNNYNPPYSIPLKTIHTILTNNINYPRVTLELAIWSCENKSHIYSISQATSIIINHIHSHPNPHAIYVLAHLSLTNQIHSKHNNTIITELEQQQTTRADNLLKQLSERRRWIVVDDTIDDNDNNNPDDIME